VLDGDHHSQAGRDLGEEGRHEQRNRDAAGNGTKSKQRRWHRGALGAERHRRTGQIGRSRRVCRAQGAGGSAARREPDTAGLNLRLRRGSTELGRR
jgi:hypothetical protein